jgi:hypothetical protein
VLWANEYCPGVWSLWAEEALSTPQLGQEVPWGEHDHQYQSWPSCALCVFDAEEGQPYSSGQRVTTIDLAKLLAMAGWEV